jgi:hypothetical protein
MKHKNTIFKLANIFEQKAKRTQASALVLKMTTDRQSGVLMR